MLPFLLLSLRQDRAVAAAEYRDFRLATGLNREQLVHRMLDRPESTTGDLSGYSGVFVGGSDLNFSRPRHGHWQRAITREVHRLLDSPVPTILTCYGSSVLAATTGGAVGRTHPESSGPTEVALTPAGREDPLFGQLPARFTALTGHTENVTALGPQATLLAAGPTCPVQAVRYGDRVWACQFHSEMDARALATRMGFFRGHGYFSEHEFDSIIAGLPAVDTTQPARLMRGFVELAVNFGRGAGVAAGTRAQRHTPTASAPAEPVGTMPLCTPF